MRDVPGSALHFSDGGLGGILGLRSMVSGGDNSVVAGGGSLLGMGSVGTAAALGLTTGKALNDFTEDHSRGRFGVDARGTARTAQGAAIDTGVAAMDGTTDWLMGLGMSAEHSNLVGNIIGSGVSAASGITIVAGNTLAMAGEGVGHAIAGGFDMLRHWVERAGGPRAARRAARTSVVRSFI